MTTEIILSPAAQLLLRRHQFLLAALALKASDDDSVWKAKLECLTSYQVH